MADDGEEEAQFRPVATAEPIAEDADNEPIQVDVGPIRDILREEILVVRQELRQEIRQEIRAELHIGPLPHPETLAGYDRLVPGSAAKIIDAFVAQGQHREKLETYVLKWDNIRSFVGLAAGFIISLIVLYLSYDLIMRGHGVEGMALAAIDVVGLAAVFVYGTHVLRDERVKKAEIMVGRGERRSKEEPKELPEESPR